MKKFLIAMLSAIWVWAAPTCIVTPKGDTYEGVIASDNTRVPDVSFSISIPETLALPKDSYFNGCVMYEDQTPVQNTLVEMRGEDWGVDANTSEYGCWNAMLPSDVNFTLRIVNPKTTEWAVFNGDITSANKGTLLSEDRVIQVKLPVQDLVTSTGVFNQGTNVKTFSQVNSNTFETEPKTILITFDKEVGVTIDTVKDKSYTMTIRITKPTTVYFYDINTGGNPRPRVTLNKIDTVMTLDSFIARGSKTTIYFATQDLGKNVITITANEL